MIRVSIGGTIYEVPQVGESPNWGKEATDTIVALADVLNTLFADGDILTTRYNLNNNVSTFTPINGLLFNSVQTKSATVSYAVIRNTDDATVTEAGTLYLNYDDGLGDWDVTRTIQNGEAFMQFDTTNVGQVEYKAHDMAGLNYTGLIIFSAKTIPR